jgi:hypothetical protein
MNNSFEIPPWSWIPFSSARDSAGDDSIAHGGRVPNATTRAYEETPR